MSDPTNKRDDDALDDYLAGDSTLSRQYRDTDQPTPSAALDRAILDAARDAVSEPVSKPRRRMTLMWERPWAVAAVIALSAILVVSIQREAGLFAPAEPASENAVDYLADDAQRATEDTDMPAARRSVAPERKALTDAAKQQDSVAGAAAEADGLVVNDVLRRERKASVQTATSPADPRRQDIVVTGSRQTGSRQTGSRVGSGVDEPVLESRQSADAEELLAAPQSTRAASAPALAATAERGPLEQTLADIGELWKTGDEAAALGALAEFRKQHPEFDEIQLREALPESMWQAIADAPR